jgi:hypothetical protein
MKNKPLEQLNQLLENSENLSVDQMDALVKNSMQFFNEYLEISKSGDKEAQEKALKELLDFKDELLGVTQKVAEQTGLSPSELSDAMKNPENFSKEQWNSMQEINETITEFNHSITPDFMPKTQKIVPKARKVSKTQHLPI